MVFVIISIFKKNILYPISKVKYRHLPSVLQSNNNAFFARSKAQFSAKFYEIEFFLNQNFKKWNQINAASKHGNILTCKILKVIE